MAELPSADKLGPYWYGLGKFAHRYAQIELSLMYALRSAAGTTIVDSKALFSGTRASAAINFIKRMYEGRGKPLPLWLERAFPKINELTTARDRLLHFGFSVSEEGAYTSDDHKMLRGTLTRFTVQTLDDLEADAITARACLVMYWIELKYPSHRYQDSWREAALAPWRYKPPQPERPPRNSRHRTPTPVLQPRPSEG